ncbi:MAG: cobyrinate a,c-diamide synthase [Magnetococcales bacterium]|nr:cobyrinate a,c-diamide synthase [Magnetococcales bacterium]
MSRKMGCDTPRVMIAAPRKSSGKTTLAIGISAALSRRGLDICPFKKGPDFIDPGWLTRAAGRSCRNLDYYMMGREGVVANFVRHAAGAELALIEGNHGFFDGQDVAGSDCGAALAADLRAPVVLVVDCRGAARGIAPVVLGHLGFPGGEAIKGVILNHVASSRHEARLLEAMIHHVPVPVLGSVRRQSGSGIEERHLGLHPAMEREDWSEQIDQIASMVEHSVDLDALLDLGRTAGTLDAPPVANPVPSTPPGGAERIRVGYAVDRAFHFYYPDNLEALAAQGVDLIPFSMLQDSCLPQGIQGVFIGGGFPEVFMQRLEGNTGLMEDLQRVARAGMPIYAECGGLMVLAQHIHWGDRVARMAGVLPIDVVMHARPQGYGYMEVEGTGLTQWPGSGIRVRCHEFHYSRLVASHPDLRFAFKVNRGTGVDGQHDGLMHRNVLAGYAHFHAAGHPGWAEFVAGFWRQGGVV